MGEKGEVTSRDSQKLTAGSKQLVPTQTVGIFIWLLIGIILALGVLSKLQDPDTCIIFAVVVFMLSAPFIAAALYFMELDASTRSVPDVEKGR